MTEDNPGESPQPEKQAEIRESVTYEDLPPEMPPAKPDERVLEEAYFHINNGGITLRIVEQVNDPVGYPNSRQVTLQIHASHFGSGLRFETPLLGRGMVSYIAEALARTGKYLEQNPDIKLHGPFGELEPWYKVVKGTPVPRKIVRHEVSAPGLAATWTENNTADMAAQVLASPAADSDSANKDGAPRSGPPYPVPDSWEAP